jgi:hypothetical protein
MKPPGPKIFVLTSGAFLLICIAFFAWRMERTARRQHEIVLGAMQQVYALAPSDIPHDDVIFGISVTGSNSFRLQIARSLLLLKIADPVAYLRVTNSIGIIRQDSRSVTFVTNLPPLITLSSTSAFYSVTWCASVLAHEAHHFELARREGTTSAFRPYYGGRLPPGYKDFQRNESDCLKVQARVLRQVGAPESEIRYIRSLTGTHFDVNRDGKWDVEDYKAQNW